MPLTQDLSYTQKFGHKQYLVKSGIAYDQSFPLFSCLIHNFFNTQKIIHPNTNMCNMSLYPFDAMVRQEFLILRNALFMVPNRARCNIIGIIECLSSPLIEWFMNSILQHKFLISETNHLPLNHSRFNKTESDPWFI